MDAKTILLVDDDTDMIIMEERWLKKEGYQVVTASSGQEALDVLKAVKPELVLLDYSMPGMDGVATLREIRKDPLTSQLPVFFLTGMEDMNSREIAGELNPQGFLSKALGKKAVIEAISEFFS